MRRQEQRGVFRNGGNTANKDEGEIRSGKKLGKWKDGHRVTEGFCAEKEYQGGMSTDQQGLGLPKEDSRSAP